MIPVKQNRFGVTEGNCLPACIASILEIGIDEVPNFCARADWVAAANRWLWTRDLWLLTIKFPDPDDIALIPQSYHLMGGKASRGHMHSVVGFAGKMVFDPHPDDSGLKTVEDFGFLVKRFVKGGER